MAVDVRVRGRAAHSLVLRELLLLWEAARQAGGPTISRKRLAGLGGIGPSTLNGWLSGRSVPRDIDRLTIVAGELSRAAGRPVRNARYWAALMEADRAHRSPRAVASGPDRQEAATGFPHAAPSPTGSGARPSAKDGDVEALCQCAELLGRTGGIAEALERPEAAAEAGHPTTHDRAGQPLAELDRVDEALSRFEWAPVDGYPEVPAARSGIGAVAGRTDQAIAWWERAWEQGVTTMREAAEVWAATGRIGEAVWHEAVALSAGHGRFGDLPRFGHIGDHVTLRERGEECERDGDLVEALGWYRKAAEAGSEAALFQAADMLERNGDRDRAVHWYELAAHRGDTYAMRELGRLLGELGRSRESISWYRAAVRAGDRHALPEVVHVVEQLDRRSATLSNRPRPRPLPLLGAAEEAADGADGTVVPRSATDRGFAGTALLPDAVELLKDAGRYFEADLLLRSADRPESDRLREASRMLAGSVSTDEAIEWVQRFADTGDLQAVSEAAEMLENRGRIDEALDWYARAADAGDRDALLAAARMLADRHQIERALDWYGRAAEAGVPSAHREAVMFRQQADAAEVEAVQRRGERIPPALSAAPVVPAQRGQAAAEAGSSHPGADPAVPAPARRVRAPRKSAAFIPRQR
ncbi:hypothetical protein [Kitasatospora griseola]|uniref:hypothetical protein n=1 Tax=Kitasatospora griseola TaxID=2064 RepID=UPI003804D038